MATTFGGTVAGTASKTAGTTLTCSAITVPANATIFLWIAFDNLTGTTPTVSSITKAGSETNSWAKAYGVPSPVATAAGGVLGELWFISTKVAWSAFAPVITLSASVTAKVVHGIWVTSPAGHTVAGTAATNAVSGSSTLSATVFPDPLDNSFGVAGIADESATIPVSANWDVGSITGDPQTKTAGLATSGSTADTNIAVRVAYGRGTEYADYAGAHGDMAEVVVSFNEAIGGGGGTTYQASGTVPIKSLTSGTVTARHPVSGVVPIKALTSGNSTIVAGAAPKIETLVDAFTSSLGPAWTNVYGGAAWESGRVAAAFTGPGYAGLETSPGSYDLTNSSIFVQVTPAPTGPQSSRETSLQLVAPGGDGAMIYVTWASDSTQNIILRKREGGSNTDDTRQYDPVAHAWWRIRHSGSTLYFETSPEGRTWTTLWTQTTTSNLSAVLVAFASGQWNGADVGSATAYFDNVNTSVPVTFQVADIWRESFEGTNAFSWVWSGPVTDVIEAQAWAKDGTRVLTSDAQAAYDVRFAPTNYPADLTVFSSWVRLRDGGTNLGGIGLFDQNGSFFTSVLIDARNGTGGTAGFQVRPYTEEFNAIGAVPVGGITVNAWYQIVVRIAAGGATLSALLFNEAGTQIASISVTLAQALPIAKLGLISYARVSWDGAQVLIPAPPVSIVSGSSGDAVVVRGSQSYPASGTVAVVSGAAGAATARHAVTGVVPLSSSVAGDVTLIPSVAWPAAGTAVITSGSSGSVAARLGSDGTVAIVSAATGDVTARHPISGSTPIFSALSGTASMQTQAEGVVPISVIAQGSPTVRAVASGVVPLVSKTTGTVSAVHAVSGVTPIVSDTLGTPTPSGSTEGLVAIVSTVSGDATVILRIPKVRSSAFGRNSGSNSVPIPIPPGIQNGDLFFTEVQIGSTSASVSDESIKGWTRLHAQAFNSRTLSVYVRIYNSADPVGNYTLGMAGSASATAGSVAVRDHAITSKAELTVQLQYPHSWRRTEQGPGSTGLIVAPSLTTWAERQLVLAFMGEATTATGGYSVTGGDFALVVDSGELTTTQIEWITIWSKEMQAQGATGDHQITYVPASANGWGAQIAIPGVLSPIQTVSSRVDVLSTVAGDVTMRVSGAAGVVPLVLALAGAPGIGYAISGVVPIVSSASGDASMRTPVSGIVPIESTISGAVTAQYSASGVTPIVSRASGTLVSVGASGVVEITSAVVGAAHKISPVAGVVPIVSGAIGEVGARRPASGVVAIVTDADGAVSAQHEASGLVPIVSVAVGTTVPTGSAGGRVNILSEALGAVTARVGVSGRVDVVSDASGAVVAAHRASGVTPILSGVVGDATPSVRGTVAIQTTVSGNVTAGHDVAATVVVVSAVSGSLVSAGLSGVVALHSTVAGDAAVGRAVAAQVVSIVSQVAGAVTQRTSVSGTIVITSAAFGSTRTGVSALGTVRAVSTLVGTVTATHQAAGVVVIVSGVYGDVTGSNDLLFPPCIGVSVEGPSLGVLASPGALGLHAFTATYTVEADVARLTLVGEGPKSILRSEESC